MGDTRTGSRVYIMQERGRIAIEGAEERERCLVRWYQGEENAAWYERVIKEEETFQTME